MLVVVVDVVVVVVDVAVAVAVAVVVMVVVVVIVVLWPGPYCQTLKLKLKLKLKQLHINDYDCNISMTNGAHKRKRMGTNEIQNEFNVQNEFNKRKLLSDNTQLTLNKLTHATFYVKDKYKDETFATFDSDFTMILLDTGASCAISMDINDFIEIDSYKDKISGLGTISVKGKGTIKWKILNDYGQTTPIII